MALLNDSLEIRLCSPDYQEDWGVLGDPMHVVLTRLRSSADVLEIGLDADSPQRELLMREMCGVVVRFRGKCEFIGHVYQRAGGVRPDAPITVYARSEDEVFDQTLAWVLPTPAVYSGSWAGLYSSSKIEAEAEKDTAQSFPDPFMDPGHYMWVWPYTDPATWTFRRKPIVVGELIAPMLVSNLKRVGYRRGTLWSVHPSTPEGDGLIEGSGINLSSLFGAPYQVVDAARWGSPTEAVPWAYGFDGFSPRFQTLREVMAAFQVWADQNTNSFNVTASGEIGGGAYNVRIGYEACPDPYPVPLSVAAGTVVDGSWSTSEHTGSRVILGGPGEQEARLFQERQQLDREQYGRVIEVFKDATGAKLMSLNQTGYEFEPRWYFVDPDVPAGYKSRARSYFDQQGARYLAEAAPETEVSVELQETSEIHYGGESGYVLGQIVSIDLGWMVLRKRVEKVTITLSREDGLKVTPQVGSEVASSDEVQARALRAVADRQRRDNSSR
ncbi:Gp37-like protein [Leucobacter sp. VD1]|uniref:Gp37-like protein n=1 Tax=Leucobacter sp. VD1 TaxID=3080381 RepID=UPI003019FA77